MKLKIRPMVAAGGMAAMMFASACQPSVAPTIESPPNTQDMEVSLGAVGFTNASCTGAVSSSFQSTVKCKADGVSNRAVSVQRDALSSYYSSMEMTLPGSERLAVNVGPSDLGQRKLGIFHLRSDNTTKKEVEHFYPYKAVDAKAAPTAQDVRIALGLRGHGDGQWKCTDVNNGGPGVECTFGTGEGRPWVTLGGTSSADNDANGGGRLVLEDASGRRAYDIRTWARQSGVRGISSYKADANGSIRLPNGDYNVKYFEYDQAR